MFSLFLQQQPFTSLARPYRPRSTANHATTRSLYSIHEHRGLASPNPALPLDITLELLTTTTLLLFSLVLSASPLRPIAWAEWAGLIEREGWDPAAEGRDTFFQSADAAGLRGVGGGDAASAKRGGTGNPWRGLEERRGFWGVREARAGFAQWVREGGK